MERRDGEKKRSAALGPGLAARDPPPPPGGGRTSPPPHRTLSPATAAAPRSTLTPPRRGAAPGTGTGARGSAAHGAAGRGGTAAAAATERGARGTLCRHRPATAPRDPFCGVGGGAARPDPPPGAGRAAGAAAGRCARVLRDGEGRCAEMGTVWDTGTVRRDGDSAQHGDSVQRWAPRAPQPGALPGMSAPGGARSAGAHRALRAITLRSVPRAAAPLCCRPVPSPRAITLVRVKTAPLRVENPAGLRSHSGWDAPGRAGRQGDAPRPRFGRWMGKARLGGKALGSVNERD